MSAATVIEEAPLEEPPAPRRRWLWAVLVVLLVAGLGASGWFFLLHDPADADEELEDGAVVDLEPLTTTTGHSGLRHARVAMSIVLVDGVDPEEVRPKVSLLRDALLQHVSRMGPDEIRSEEGSEQLRESLTADAHDIWGEDLVRRVLLTELLVQ